MRFKLLREGVETDSLGNVLSDEQVKYFKNSKIRDRQGRLLVVHHGTYNSFDSFDAGDIGFHFGTEKAANERKDFYDDTPDREWSVGKYYLNITNFLDMYDIADWDGSNLAAHIIESRLLDLSDEDIRYLQQIQMVGGLGMGRNHNPTTLLRQFLIDKGIDGIMYENAYEDSGSLSYIAFNPEQIKPISNKTPTSSKNLNEKSDNLSYDKFEQSVFDCANVIVEQITSSFLDKYGFEIDLITDYEDYDIDEHCVGMFLSSEQDDASVFPIVLNPKAMYNALLDISDTIEHRDIVGAVKSTLWHEVGHGIVSYLSDVFDFDWDEEEVVEEFAIQMCDTGRADCDLTDALKEFEDGLLEEDKIVNKPGYYSSNFLYEEADDNNNVFVDYLSRLKDEYPNLTSDELIHFLNIPTRNDIDADSPMFILPNGKIVSVKDVLDANKYDFELTHNALCQCYMYKLISKFGYSDEEFVEIADNDWKLEPYEFKILDTITYQLNWARINCGRTWSESRFYCVLPDTMTPSQYRTLEEWIEWGEDSGRKNVLIFATKRTENYTYSLVDNMPEEIIRNIKRYYSSGKFYESRIVNKPVNKKLTESLQRLAPNAFITDSPYQIRDLLINKPKLYRILYDSNIDMYMIGDGQEVIHWDLIRAARRLGYYAEMESFIDELGDLDNYVEFGGGGQFLDDEEIESYLIYMVFSPDDEEFILGEDGYQFQYQLPFGYMFTRDSYLEDCDLYKVVKANQSLTEGKKDFSHLYPSVQEVQNYIDNNYSVDTLPPTGATFLMPNGLFIDLGASHMTVHQEFDEQVYNDLVEDGDYVGEFGYTDLFLPRLGFIRCNDGTTMGSLLVHLPSQKPTREQYKALEGWLDASLSMDMYNYIIIATDKFTKRYDTGDYMTDELIALIKRYYSSGRLYEEDEREVTSVEQPTSQEHDDEPDSIDKAQEIKDNIKVSFTENS